MGSPSQSMPAATPLTAETQEGAVAAAPAVALVVGAAVTLQG